MGQSKWAFRLGPQQALNKHGELKSLFFNLNYVIGSNNYIPYSLGEKKMNKWICEIS